MKTFPQFVRILRDIGATHPDRASALDVSTKTISRYLDSDLPEPILKLMRQPALLRALAEDAEQADEHVLSAA
jgi:predicted transcriptional regulator